MNILKIWFGGLIVTGILMLAGPVSAIDAEIALPINPKVRLTSICRLNENTGLMRFREESTGSFSISWNDNFSNNGVLNAGQTSFFEVPAAQTVIVNWSCAEGCDKSGKETKAQNATMCTVYEACVDGKTVSWIENRDGMLPENAYKGSCQVEVSPSPTPSPSVSPTPSPTPSVGKNSKLGSDIKVCEPSFVVTMDLTDNGNPVENVEVTFKYNPEVKVKTNKDGRARASFSWLSSNVVSASADGFASQEIRVERPACDEKVEVGIGGGDVLGATTERGRGQVLGATTLAETGSQNFYMAAMLMIAGLGITVVSAREIL